MELIGDKKVTQEEYNKVETVYIYYSNIRYKKHIANLFLEFGIVLIDIKI